MYSMVLAVVMAGSTEVPDWGRRRGRHSWCGGGYSSGYVCPPVYYGCGGYGAGGWIASGGTFSPGYPGGGSSLQGGPYPGSQGAGSGGQTERSLADLKKEIESLKKEQARRQIEGLKSKIEELRAERTDQKIEELRRTIEQMRRTPHGGERLLPPPFPRDLHPLPSPRSSPPELPSPRQALIRLRVPSGARLFVNGRKLDPAATFLTPELDPDKDYDYEFRVKVTHGDKDIVRVKRVNVRAGSVVHVDYEDMVAVDEPSAGPAKEAPAHITVRLPEGARLYVHGVFCPLTSGSRSFDTPRLQPGRRYLYILRAETARDGRTVTETRRVIFRAGEDVTVNFNEPDNGAGAGG